MGHPEQAPPPPLTFVPSPQTPATQLLDTCSLALIASRVPTGPTGSVGSHTCRLSHRQITSRLEALQSHLPNLSDLRQTPFPWGSISSFGK